MSLNGKIYRMIDQSLEKSSQGKFNEAIGILQSAAKSLSKEKNPSIYAKITYELGSNYFNLFDQGDLIDNLNNSMKYLTECLSFYTKEADPYVHSSVSNLLGRVNMSIFENNKKTEVLESAISYFEQAIADLSLSDVFTAASDYKTNKKIHLEEREYAYLRALIQYNLARALKEKTNLYEGCREKYIDALRTSISLFSKVTSIEKLHQADYLNAYFNIGACYDLLSDEVDKEDNLKEAVTSFESAIKYYFSNAKFKEMYPQFFDHVFSRIVLVKEKLGQNADRDYYINMEKAQQQETDVCSSCGNANVIKGYTIPLCEQCRKAYLKYPIPKWIKVFAVCVLAILTFAFLKFPSSLNVGLNYEKGLRADKDKKCTTALKYLEKAHEKYPNSFAINSRMFISLAKCSKYEEAADIYNQSIAGKETEDNHLYKEINQMYKKVFMPDENYNEFKEIIQSSSNKSLDDLVKKLEDYNQKYPNNVEGLASLSNIYFSQGKFSEARDLDIKALNRQPERDDIRLDLAAIYRQTGEFVKSMTECRYILENINSENTMALGNISRLYIKKHDFKEALVYARKALSLDSETEYNIETIALAYHFNHMVEERDEAYKKIKNMKYNERKKQSDLEFLQEVFQGKSKLYN